MPHWIHRITTTYGHQLTTSCFRELISSKPWWWHWLAVNYQWNKKATFLSDEFLKNIFCIKKKLFNLVVQWCLTCNCPHFIQYPAFELKRTNLFLINNIYCYTGITNMFKIAPISSIQKSCDPCKCEILISQLLFPGNPILNIPNYKENWMEWLKELVKYDGIFGAFPTKHIKIKTHIFIGCLINFSIFQNNW